MFAIMHIPTPPIGGHVLFCYNNNPNKPNPNLILIIFCYNLILLLNIPNITNCLLLARNNLCHNWFLLIFLLSAYLYKFLYIHSDTLPIQCINDAFMQKGCIQLNVYTFTATIHIYLSFNLAGM